MIKTNELRQGNWVLGKSAKPVEVSEIFGDYGINSHYGEPELSCQEIEPIPLTHEILEKCGLKKEHDGNYSFPGHRLPPLFFLFDDQYTIQGVPWRANPIKYLHQLQNIYFALTDEELTIKL